MKTLPPDLALHLPSTTTTLCTLWRVARQDGIVLGFTDHDCDIEVDGLIYRASSSAYSRTAIANSASLAVDNLDIEAILSSDAITAEDLRAGLYDHAEINVSLVNWAAPADGAVLLRRGWLGEVRIADGVFVAEIRGLAQALTRAAVELYTADCRAQLGDSRCGLDLAAWTDTGTVTSVADPRRAFTATLSTGRAAGFHSGGQITWTSGNNAGRAIEVKSHGSDDAFTLFLPMARPIQAGDTFTVVSGCDKQLATCRDKFANLVNFRGEPYVPGLDYLTRTPNVT